MLRTTFSHPAPHQHPPTPLISEEPDCLTPYSDMVAYLRAVAEAPYTAVERAAKPPTVLAALGPRMLRLSAEAADGGHRL